MKKRTLWLLTALLLICLAASAGAEASQEERIDRYLGGWVSDDYRMYIRSEDDEIFARLTETESDYVWEFDRCWYDEKEDRLYGPNYVRYRQVIDWDSMELLEEDWSMGDLSFTCFAFGDDEDTLIASDIPYIDEPLTFHRVDDEEFFGS